MARSFIASTNQASFGDTTDFDGASSCTWAGWVSPVSLASGYEGRLWAKWGSTTDDSAFLAGIDPGGKLALAVRSQETAALLLKSTTDVVLVPGQWRHCIWEWTGGTTINFYVGAASVPVTTTVNNSIGSIRNAAVAETFCKDGVGYSGARAAYDRFGAWKNVTLTQGEKAELAAGADPATIRPAALIALPTFERSGAVWDRKRGIVAALTGTLEAETGAPLRLLDGASVDDDDEMAAAAPPASTTYPQLERGTRGLMRGVSLGRAA